MELTRLTRFYWNFLEKLFLLSNLGGIKSCNNM